MAHKIALYGGSFDPIHNAHLIVARAIAEQLGLDRVVFLPSARPPHKRARTLVTPRHRAAMVKSAIQNEALFEFSDFDLTREGPSYTIDTVTHYRESLGGGARLCWIIGADSLAELTTWRRVGDLVDACEIITAARPGFDTTSWLELEKILTKEQVAAIQSGVVPTPLIEISATDIRRRVSKGLSIRYMVPDQVLAYIERHALYTEDKG